MLIILISINVKSINLFDRLGIKTKTLYLVAVAKQAAFGCLTSLHSEAFLNHMENSWYGFFDSKFDSSNTLPLSLYETLISVNNNNSNLYVNNEHNNN
jgi:hypothetical protein